MKNRKIRNIYITKYDGYIICVNNDDSIEAYEGIDLCPDKIKVWLKNNKLIELDEFSYDAISYGLCK